jgi:hypothetical protein
LRIPDRPDATLNRGHRDAERDPNESGARSTHEFFEITDPDFSSQQKSSAKSLF